MTNRLKLHLRKQEMILNRNLLEKLFELLIFTPLKCKWGCFFKRWFVKCRPFIFKDSVNVATQEFLNVRDVWNGY